MSETYCDSCTEKGIEVWWVVLSIIDMCIHGQFKVEWRISVAPWAVEIIDRSMAFYGKTEEQMLKDSRGDERDTTANG
jgi:hypothetical protein